MTPAWPEWQDISTCPRDGTEFDAWMDIPACPSSMGFADNFRVVNVSFRNGVFGHQHEGSWRELCGEWLSHWLPLPPAPPLAPPAARAGSGKPLPGHAVYE